MMISRSAVPGAPPFPSFMTLLLPLHFAQIVVQPPETVLPQAAIAFHPVRDALERGRLEMAGPPLCLVATRDQTGALPESVFDIYVK